jgi:hypothetical protein
MTMLGTVADLQISTAAEEHDPIRPTESCLLVVGYHRLDMPRRSTGTASWGIEQPTE